MLAAARQQIRNLISSYPLLFIGFGLQDEYVMDALETVLEMFKGNLQPSYALLKKGDSRAAELWKKYSIDVVEFDDYGQPLVDRVTQIRVEATAWSERPGDTDPGPLPIPASYVKWLTDQCADITPFGMSPREGQSVCLQQVYVPPVTMRRLEITDGPSDSVGLQTSKAAGKRARQRLPNLSAGLDTGVGQRC